MARSESKRRLAAILAADVVGYSGLMGTDETRTIRMMQGAHRELVDPAIRSSNGQIVKRMGDGYLVEFSAASDAVACADAWQSKMQEMRERGSFDPDLEFRIGINLGEVYSEGGEIYGDGVNIAARLESLCPPGGICVSEIVRSALRAYPEIQFEDFGVHQLKNITIPIHAYLVSVEHDQDEEDPNHIGFQDQSEIRYCVSKDGTSVAYAQVGSGYPLVIAGSWMTHLEWDWEAPTFGPLLSSLAKHFTIIRYDQRGNGMSDWNNVDVTFDKMVDDMERVIDQYNLEKVAILGMSQGTSVALAYAKRCVERVSHLILYGGYARGRRRRGSEKDKEESEALVSLIRHGWAAENPAFRQTITTLFMPDATPAEAAWFNEFQKASGTGENMARFREMFDEMDVSDLLNDMSTPTLVLHCDEDAIAPISEGKFLASRVCGARFIKFKSKNHMMFGNEPDFPKLVASIVGFID